MLRVTDEEDPLFRRQNLPIKWRFCSMLVFHVEIDIMLLLPHILEMFKFSAANP